MLEVAPAIAAATRRSSGIAARSVSAPKDRRSAAAASVARIARRCATEAAAAGAAARASSCTRHRPPSRAKSSGGVGRLSTGRGGMDSSLYRMESGPLVAEKCGFVKNLPLRKIVGARRTRRNHELTPQSRCGFGGCCPGPPDGLAPPWTIPRPPDRHSSNTLPAGAA